LAVRANKSAVRADKFYQSARSMLDQLGMQIAQQLDDVPGADAIREDLLKQAQQYCKSFIEAARSDPRLRVDAAVTLGKLGSLFEQLADSQQSLDAHQKAATILHDLAAKDPGNFKIESQLAVAENNVGLALRRMGKKEPAPEQLQPATRRQGEMRALEPH